MKTKNYAIQWRQTKGGTGRYFLMGQGMEGKAGHDGNFFLEITPRDRSFFPHFSADRVSRRADLSETPMGPRKFSHVLFAHFFIFVSKDIVAGLWAIAPSGQEEEGQGKSFARRQGRGGEYFGAICRHLLLQWMELW